MLKKLRKVFISSWSPIDRLVATKSRIRELRDELESLEAQARRIEFDLNSNYATREIEL